MVPAAFADDSVTITCPDPITVEATELGGALVVPGTATASSTVPGPVTIVGPATAVYPLGTTIVVYTATDSAGNQASCSTSITVIDTTAPTIICPAAITAEATQPFAAFVVVPPATASDIAGPVTVSGPSSGVFPLGTTAVTFTATDASGNSSSCTTFVTVVDTTPPTITCPSNITVVAGAGGTAVVTYSAVASDIAGPVTISYSPASGSTFAVGTTPVVATATDASGLTTQCGFTVTVTPFVPTTSDECRNGGWMAFGIFKNQGECISFVTGRRGGSP
jgi:large repetitive protein